jgi:hypothetical protein
LLIASTGRLPLQAVLLAVVLVHNPTLLQHLMAINLAPGVTEEEEREKWDALVVSLLSVLSLLGMLSLLSLLGLGWLAMNRCACWAR